MYMMEHQGEHLRHVGCWCIVFPFALDIQLLNPYRLPSLKFVVTLFTIGH